MPPAMAPAGGPEELVAEEVVASAATVAAGEAVAVGEEVGGAVGARVANAP